MKFLDLIKGTQSRFKYYIHILYSTNNTKQYKDSSLKYIGRKMPLIFVKK